jgi:uncharacterized protein (TIRG00374 family)
VTLSITGNRAWIPIVKIAVSAAVFAYVLSRIPLGDLKGLFLSLQWGYLVGGLAVLLLSVFLGSFQWSLLLRAEAVLIPYARVAVFYFVGLFFNNFLPANVGADVSRSYQAIRYGGKRREVVSATVMDRVVGLLTLCLLAVLFSVLFMDRFKVSEYFVPILVFLVICLAVSAALLNRRLMGLLEKPFSNIKTADIAGRVRRLCDALHLLTRKRVLLLHVGLLAVVIQILRVVVHILVARSLGLDIPVVYFFFFVPVIAIAAALPISINGIGVREGAGILMFGTVGLSADQAFAMQFLAYVIMVAVSLVGGILFLLPSGINKEMAVARSDVGLHVQQ